ncbi:AlkA N-terminal domain-containing protein [Sinomonas sp. ASV322]|uniref:DNA-3-methyladenine glycosylase 2 n=1 Tax=Sinomonas sp. ASV322 TaxID=3041920 RepID=UPI0027DE4EFA|nr:AlkA N-terminal domain-containing protein [Sinomonas sp. ASV322]MDQ4503040.1 AlkA N-terminal domain-containing protein [Sinomonas sp. ASV322]
MVVIVRVEAPGGLDPEAVLGSLAAHTIPGAERTDREAGTHSRLVSLASGPCAVTIRPDAHGVELRAESGAELSRAGLTGTERSRTELSRAGSQTDLGVPASLVALVREWFDLDADLEPVRDFLSGDQFLAPLLAARPGLRVIGTTDRFQTAVTTVLGQQVSLAAGRTFSGRLVATYGTDGPGGLRCFPEAAVLADADTEELRAAVGLTSARARTISSMSRLWAESGETPGRKALLAVTGIGPWTVDYLAVRYGDRDAFTPGDLVLRRALGGVSPHEAETRSEAWRPYRAYALMHLWTEAAYAGTSPSEPAPSGV